MFELLLARVDIGHVIGILFLVISVLSWFVNVIQGNTPDGAPRPQKPKPKPPTGQSEIESLLQELSGGRLAPKPEKAQPPQRPQKPPAERNRPKPQAGRQKPNSPGGTHASRPTPRVAETQLPSANLGAGVRSLNLGNRVEAAVEQEVTSVVQHDLGKRDSTAIMGVKRPVHPIVKVLRDRDGVRQAIILNEILQRPRSLRR